MDGCIISAMATHKFQGLKIFLESINGFSNSVACFKREVRITDLQASYCNYKLEYIDIIKTFID